MDRHLQAVSDKFGIHFMGVDAKLLPTEKELGGRLAMDATPELVSISNSGIPAFLSTYIDPNVIEFLIAPNKATEIVGQETKKGDWTMETSMFPIVEYTGMVSSYGDYSETGIGGANTNWVQRQSYTYQITVEYGEREIEKMGLARLNWANEKRAGAISTLNKFQNKTYFYGVNGLANYGLLNDPSLFAPIAPINVGGLVTWAQKATDPNGAIYVYNDIKAVYGQLVSQAEGNVELDMASPLTLAMSPAAQVYLTLTTQYNVNVQDMLKKNFPKMKIETAPEYDLGTNGHFMQLIADDMRGQRTATTAFTEKLRSHPIIIRESSFRQKLSQGSWGTILFRPFLISSMVGF
jgi:hypothetical protein